MRMAMGVIDNECVKSDLFLNALVYDFHNQIFEVICVEGTPSNDELHQLARCHSSNALQIDNLA